MRKFLISIICALCVCSAFAAGENVATSKVFVDAAVAQKQDKIPANTNPNNSPDQVLTNTGTAGTVGTKDVYDSSAAYADQTDALVDAQTMNAAVQTAIEAEFKCIKWVDDDPTKDCLLVNIFGTTGKSTLPAGYTALEYIESTGTQWVDTGVWIEKNKSAKLELLLSDVNGGWMGANAFLQLQVYKSHYAIVANTTPGANINQSERNSIVMDYDIQHYLNLYVNGGFVQSAYWGSMDYSHSALCIFALGNFRGGCISGSPVSGKLYMAKLSIDNEIILNMVPARRDSDNEIGMYDMVSGTFFTKTGTGNFIAGPVTNLYLPSGN